jgi:hypothetical protein
MTNNEIARIKDWLYDHIEYVNYLRDEALKAKELQLQLYPLFYEEIEAEFQSYCLSKIAFEVSWVISANTEDVIIALEECGILG